MSLKAQIEAVLFLTDRPMRAQAIAGLVNADLQLVRQTLIELIHEYEERQGGLEIAQDNGYIIQVKDEYANIVEEFLPMEMSAALVRTLSAIAIKQPVAQSEIIKIRGAGAYEHIKELINRSLIAKKEEGRSPTLTTTKKFQEYFRLTRDAKSLRQDMRRQEAQSNQLKLDVAGSADAAAVAEGEAITQADDSTADELLDRLLDSALDNVAEGDDGPVSDPEPEASGEDSSQSDEEIAVPPADGATVT